MAVELSNVIYEVPTLSGKLQKLSFFHDEDTQNEFDKEKWESHQQQEHKLNDVHNEQQIEQTIMPVSTQSKPPVTTEPYEIKLVKSSDHERVLEHLRRFFFKDEPLNQAVELLAESDTCKELEEFSCKCLSDGCSYMAVSESDVVVGVSVNAIDRPPNKDDPVEIGDCGNPKFQKILNLLDTVDRELDIFNKYPGLNSVMNCKILSVDSTWRGRGLAKALLDKTRDVAKEQGHGLMRVDCTSLFSAKAIARLGFECIYTKKYEDHMENGEIVFKPEPPHTEVAVYVQHITKDFC